MQTKYYPYSNLKHYPIYYFDSLASKIATPVSESKTFYDDMTSVGVAMKTESYIC